MGETHTIRVRSYNMSKIRSKNTKPEEFIRKYLFNQGFRYRKNVRSMPGCPDVVLPRYKTVIFINGCFWHKHEGCKNFVWPKSNEDYWRPKIERNVCRDKKNISDLENSGWHVIVIWECEIRNNRNEVYKYKLIPLFEARGESNSETSL